MTHTEKNDVYIWKCPICDQTIKSMYPKQLEANQTNHNLKHKLKQKEGEKNE